MKKFLLPLLLFALAFPCLAGGGVSGTNQSAAATNQPVTFAEIKELALKGDARAEFELGIRYLTGNGVEKDPAEGFNWIQKAAGHNLTRAQFVLASAYINGDGVPKDVSQGVSWLRRAAGQGMVAAQYELGALYYEGTAVARNYDEAIKWFQLGADHGDPAAQQLLGVCYINGQGVKQDPVEAFKWLQLASQSGAKGADTDLNKLSIALSAEQIADAKRRAAAFVPKKSGDDSPTFFDPAKSLPSEWGKTTVRNTWPPEDAKPTIANTGAPFAELKAAAEKGDVQAQVELGLRLSLGRGVTTNIAEAADWFRKAGDAGYPEGRLQLAFLAINSRNAVQMQRGIELIQKMAEGGYVRAQTMLGVVLITGTLFEKDDVEGIKWLRRAAVHDEPLAVMMLAISYTAGTNGVAKDEAEGRKWMTKAAEQDNALAQYLLGQDLILPTHPAADQAEGVKWLKSAAEQNIMMAQVVLAGCYQRGMGTAKDPVEAFKWYKIAGGQATADPGIPPDLLDQLTPEQLAEGSRLAAAFKPRRTRLTSSFPMEPPPDLLKTK